MSSKLNKIKNLKKKNLKECFQEEYCKYCTYCPGITFLENKFLERYEPFCKEAKIKMALSKQKHEEIEK